MRLELGNQHGRFLTLTYAEDPGTLDPNDAKNFIRRHKRIYGNDIRYFGVGEYGTKHGRGHWHFIIFNQTNETIGKHEGLRSWDKGFVYDGTAEPASIGYVAGYCLKKINPHVDNRPLLYRTTNPFGIGVNEIRYMGERYATRFVRAHRAPSIFPDYYRIGNGSYPFHAHVKKHFIESYFNSGGLEPTEATNPEVLDLEARAQLAALGPRIEYERQARSEFYEDRAAIQKLRRKRETL